MRQSFLPGQKTVDGCSDFAVNQAALMLPRGPGSADTTMTRTWATGSPSLGPLPSKGFGFRISGSLAIHSPSEVMPCGTVVSVNDPTVAGFTPCYCLVVHVS